MRLRLLAGVSVLLTGPLMTASGCAGAVAGASSQETSEALPATSGTPAGRGTPGATSSSGSASRSPSVRQSGRPVGASGSTSTAAAERCRAADLAVATSDVRGIGPTP